MKGTSWQTLVPSDWRAVAHIFVTIAKLGFSSDLLGFQTTYRVLPLPIMSEVVLTL
jgi:hypothetical protein